MNPCMHFLTVSIVHYADVQQQVDLSISQQNESRRQMQEEMSRQGEAITQLQQHHEAVQISSQKVTGINNFPNRYYSCFI